MPVVRLVWAVLVTAVAACSAGPAVPRAPVAPPPATVSPVTSAVRTTALSRDELTEQALATVRAYYAALNVALRTGRTDELRAMSTSGCSCRGVLAYIDDRWSAGSVSGDGYAISGLRVREMSAAVAVLAFTYRVGPFVERDRAGRVVGRVPPVPETRGEVQLVRRSGRWLIADVARFQRR